MIEKKKDVVEILTTLMCRVKYTGRTPFSAQEITGLATAGSTWEDKGTGHVVATIRLTEQIPLGRMHLALAPRGVCSKSLYYVSQPHGTRKSSRELVRETSDKSVLPSESAQQSIIENANQLLLGTQ